MALMVGQLEFNGLVMGAGTDYYVKSVKGLRSNPPQRLTKVPRPQQDGAVPMWSYLDQRIVTITMMIVPDSGTVNADVEALMTAIVATDNPAYIGPLQFMFDSAWPHNRQVMCRCTSDDLDWDVLAQAAIVGSDFTIEFTCDDPVIYDPNTSDHDQSTTNFSATYGSSDNISISLACDNFGNWRTWPVITVSDVGTGIIFVDGASAFTWTGAMGGSSPWVFDCANKAVTDTNGNSQIGALGDYAWPSFGPGSHVVSCAGQIGASPKLEVVFSPAWAAT